MLVRVTTLFLVFGMGWNLNDRFQEGLVWTVLNRTLNYEDITRAVWMIGAGLLVATIAKHGEPVLKRFSAKMNRAEAWAHRATGK